MKKYLKGCTVITGVMLLLLILLAAWIWKGWDSRRKQAIKDRAKGSGICDTAIYITEQPELSFIGFRNAELQILKFQILRNSMLIEDTVIRTGLKNSAGKELLRIRISYTQFMKTDTLVLTISNRLQYYISGYHHYAYLHYGMFGYLGSYNCRFSEECIINNREANGAIERINGWIDPERSKPVKFISSGTEEYKELAEKYIIREKDAENIFSKHRQNKTLYSMYSYGVEVTPDSSYYIFGEEMENRRGQIDIIKINTSTGAYRRYRNYPLIMTQNN